MRLGEETPKHGLLVQRIRDTFRLSEQSIGQSFRFKGKECGSRTDSNEIVTVKSENKSAFYKAADHEGKCCDTHILQIAAWCEQVRERIPPALQAFNVKYDIDR